MRELLASCQSSCFEKQRFEEAESSYLHCKTKQGRAGVNDFLKVDIKASDASKTTMLKTEPLNLG